MKAIDQKLGRDPVESLSSLKGVRIVVIGYDADACDHAHALRAAGHLVTIAMRTDGAAQVVREAQIVVVLDGDPRQTWRRVEPDVAAGALVVFDSARVLDAGIVTRRGFDVVLVKTPDAGDSACRAATEQDATGRALVRAISYARAVCGNEIAVRLTTVFGEAEEERARAICGAV
jgi:ketol-acid reductoisomerase